METVRSVLAVGSVANRLLRVSLAAIAIGVSLLSFVDLARLYAWGVDALIPLEAAHRWASGGAPYLASSFAAPPGYDLPFLYPPPVLPLVRPLLALPVPLVVLVWLLVGAAAAGVAAWRTAIPLRWIPVVLIWPPFAEAIVAGNVESILFLAFVLLYTATPRSERPWRPVPHDPRQRGRPVLVDGALAACIAAVKLSQGYAWANLLRRRPGAAAAGAALAVAGVAVTLPIVGVEAWREWVAQIGRAADPAWSLSGAGLDALLPSALRPVIIVAGLVLAFRARADDAGATVGAVLVVLGQSLRMFGVLFLVPALLTVRREIALVAATFIATYTLPGLWIGIGMTVAALVGSRWAPALREPEPVRAPAGTRRLASTRRT